MREDLPSWAEDDDARASGARAVSRPWVLVLAGLPWLVVVGLVLTGPLGGGPRAPDVPVADPGTESGDAPIADDPGAGPVAGDGVVPEQRDGDTPVPEHAPGDAPAAANGPGDADGADGTAPAPTAPGADRPGGSTPSGPATGTEPQESRVAATALLVARAWLTDVGPRLEVAGLRPRGDVYLEHAAVETIDVFGEHAVVTLSAVVLEREEDAYAAAEPRRLGVPVALGDPPRPAGEPWWLEDPDLSLAEPELVEERDPDTLLALGEALEELGTPTGDVHEAARTAGGWWIVTADPPPDGDGEPVRVWLRPDVNAPAAGAGSPSGHDAEDQE